MLFMYRFPKYLNNVSYTHPHTPRKGENERHTHATPTPHANEQGGVNVIFDWLKLTAITAFRFVIG